MRKSEEAFRDDYVLRKNEFHDHFSKQDYPAVYPDYDPMKPDSGQRRISVRFSAAQETGRLWGNNNNLPPKA